MKTIFKSLFSSLNLFIIAFTLTLGPVAFDNSAYAEEPAAPSTECGSGSEQDEDEVYRAGCDQAMAVRASQLSSSSEDQGMIMGIIQQAIAAMMAVVLIKTLLYRYNRVYAQDCPMDKTARATMLMAQLSSLSYLVGDLVSNLKYKKLAKEAADKAFAVTNKADVENTKGEERVKAKEYNDEQVKSFDTMIEVFDGQEKALETKLALTTVAELGYIAAEVVELVGIAGTTATATTSTATYCSARNSALASIFASQAAFTPLSGIIPSCAASASIIAEKYSRETAMTLTKSTQQALDSLETKTWFGRQLAFFTKQFKDLINVVTSSFNQVLGLFGKIPTERMVEKAKEDARSAEQVAATQSETAADSLEISSLSTATTACIGGASALVPASAATVTAATGASTAALSAFSAEKAADMIPVLCSGQTGDLGAGTAGRNISCLTPDLTLNWQRQDYLPNSGYAYHHKDEFNPKDVFTTIIENSLYASVYKMYDSSLSASANLNKFVRSNNKIDKKMQQVRLLLDDVQINENFFNDQNNINELALNIKSLLSNLAPIPNTNANMITGAISSMVMKKIGKKLGGPWEEILNLGAKYQMLSGLLDSIGQQWAFVKKKNRAITWGLMTVVNTSVLVFDAKSLKKVKEHRKRVEDDKERFIKAAGEGLTPIGEGDGTEGPGMGDGGHDYSDVPLFGDGEMDIKACVSPVAGGFIPDSCEGKRSKKPYEIPSLSFKNVGGVDYKGLNNALGFLGSSAYNAGSGAYLNNGGLAGSTFAGASAHRNALNKIKKKLIDKIDKVEKKYARSKSKSGKTLVSPLASIQKEFDNIYGKPIAIGDTDVKSLLAEEDGKKESKKVAVVAPNILKRPAPKSSLGADFSLGFDEFEDEKKDEVAKATGPGDLIIEHQDIVKKPEVSIFKLLSNRYIISYPKLLEEK